MADKHQCKHIKLTAHPGMGGARPNIMYDAIVRAEIGAEIDAKIATGYFTPDGMAPAPGELAKPKDRSLAE